MKRLIIGVFVLGFLPMLAFAQFTVNAELRPRAEIRKGYKALPDSLSVPSSIISQRTRIGFTYQKDWLKTSVTIQDARMRGFGETKIPSIQPEFMATRQVLIFMKAGWNFRFLNIHL